MRVIGHADELVRRAGGIAQRADQVENRPKRQAAPHRREPRQAGVIPGGKQEGERDLGQAASARPRARGRCATPSAASTSELPARLVAARFPCLTTGTWQAAATMAAAVEILIVPAPSPPVPQVSSRRSRAIPLSHGVIRSRTARTVPSSSSAVSPFSRQAVRNRAARSVGRFAVEQGADRLAAFPPLKAPFPPLSLSRAPSQGAHHGTRTVCCSILPLFSGQGS